METEQLKPVVEIGEQLERIHVREADQLSALCLEIYPQYYLHLWYDHGAWYQQMRYSPAALAKELADAHSEFYWINKEGRHVGYLKINLDAQPDTGTFPADSPGLEVERIYLLSAYAGMKLGQQAMVWAETRARQTEKAYVFLYTMDSSEARWFYQKAGYEIRGKKRLSFEKMKPEYQGMYLMLKELR
jgi:diamine N-acetyltransferase